MSPLTSIRNQASSSFHQDPLGSSSSLGPPQRGSLIPSNNMDSLCDELSKHEYEDIVEVDYFFGTVNVKAGFHMIADDRRSQKVLRSSAIMIAEYRRRSQEIKPCSIFCDHLRSFAILRSYGNQSSAICNRNVSHNIFNSDP